MDKTVRLKTIQFGRYPQNGSAPEALEWLVLEETKAEMLLLCRFSIATRGFVFNYAPESHEYRKCLWEYSDLRRWLHEEFFPAAFTREETAHILTTEIRTLPNDTEPLETFENKVFLLSREQVEKYLPTPELRRGIRTPNAANDPNVLPPDRKKLENTPWWILPELQRGAFGISTGPNKNKHFSYIAYPQMAFDQGTQYHGRNFMHQDWSVRPAIRLAKCSKTTADSMKRFEYRRLLNSDKVFKLDHETLRAYTLNARNAWEPTKNGVYEDLAHGHIGSEVISFNDVFPTEA